MSQSPLFKYTESIDYLGDFPGAERERDRLRVLVAAGSVDVTDRAQRALGKVSVTGTPIEDALASEGLDHLLVGQEDGEVWSVTQDAPVEVGTWSAGNLTVEQAAALEIGTWNAGTLAVQEDTSLDVSGATVPVSHQGVIDVSSRDGRNLGDVDVTDLPDSDYAEADAATLNADATNSYSLAATGADALDGRVTASGTHDVAVEWQLSTGTVVKTESVASGVAGGTWTDLTGLEAITPYAVVKITDTSSAAQTTTVAAHLR